MPNFSIATQIKKEVEEFANTSVSLAEYRRVGEGGTIRYLKDPKGTYKYNQRETITIIDLYDASKFENGEKDALGQQKIFLNVGTFRREVASKQIDLDVKDFRFIPDDYADPWTSFFLQKDFKEWAKESFLSELLNDLVEAFPKYGTVVVKKVGKSIQFMPLQNLINEQTARSLKTAAYVIEEHPDMYLWEMQDMPEWNCDGLKLKYNDTLKVYERYGRVPMVWFKKQTDQPVEEGDANRSIDVVAIVGVDAPKEGGNKGEHVFFVEECKAEDRPYEEAHWSRRHGRWLGVGVMEDLFENQRAKNIVINLIRRSMHWSSKRVLQSGNSDVAGKNLLRDVADGDIIEVGQNGEIKEVPLSAKTNADFTAFLGEFEKNSDQKAFTYEVATGEALPSGTPFRLGVVLTNSVNQYYGGKRERLGLFCRNMIINFALPQFLKDMGNKEKIKAFYSDEPGYNALKAAAIQYVRSEACRLSALSGKPVDAAALEQIISPYEEVHVLFFKLPGSAYTDAKYKFDLDITGESVDLPAKIETLKSLYQSLMAVGDTKRAEAVLNTIAALAGINMATFGPAPSATPPAPTDGSVKSPIQLNANTANQGAAA